MKNHAGGTSISWRMLIAVPVIVGALMAPQIRAQAPTSQTSTATSSVPQWQIDAGGKMAFDVASVKQDTAEQSASTVQSNIRMGPNDFFTPTGGRFFATDLHLVDYMVFAYKLSTSQSIGAASQLPKWANNNRYDIEGRGLANATKDQLRLMMQSLLEDRFKLVIHFETRQLRVMALVLDKPGKLGPHLRPHLDDPPCSTAPSNSALPETVAGGFPVPCGATTLWNSPTAGRFVYGSRNISMATFVRSVYIASLVGTELPIVDKTGLAGTYDFVMEYTLDPNGLPPGATFQPDPTAPTFLEALKGTVRLEV